MPEKSQINLTCQYKVQNESLTIVILTPCKMTTSQDHARADAVKMCLFLVLNIVTYNEYELDI